MERLLQTISTFPTVPLTVLLGVVVAYWIFALITGAAFDGGDAVAGGMKAAGDATAGAIKGAGDAVASLKGTMEGLGETADVDADVEGADAGLLSMLGLGKVPITITASVVALVAWTACALVSLSLGPTNVLISTGLLAGSFFTGLLGASLFLRPLNKALSQSRPARRRDSLGQICTITSGKVDATFGTAHVDDGAAGLNVHVVCSKANTLKKGDRAILVDFDAAKETYEIEPVDWLLPQELEALNDPTRAAQVISGRVRRR
jgi:hypothetical protein